MAIHEYIRGVVEDPEEDADFKCSPWLSAMEFFGGDGMFDSVPNAHLGYIKWYLKNGKLDQALSQVFWGLILGTSINEHSRMTQRLSRKPSRNNRSSTIETILSRDHNRSSRIRPCFGSLSGIKADVKDIWKIREQLTKLVTWPPLIWGLIWGVASFGTSWGSGVSRSKHFSFLTRKGRREGSISTEVGSLIHCILKNELLNEEAAASCSPAEICLKKLRRIPGHIKGRAASTKHILVISGQMKEEQMKVQEEHKQMKDKMDFMMTRLLKISGSQN